MKKMKLFATLLCTASMIAGSVMPAVPAMADSVKVVTLGADLSDDQKNTMLKYFNVNANEVQILYITNADEKAHLSAYVPAEQIGSRTVSCAYVKPTTSGGIKVRTANLNWVTGSMIASTLSTSGVKNCEVVAACPFEVSGTGALTGIQMAYETASGETLDATKKQIATQEMVVTGKLADDVGQKDATAVINQAKMQVIANSVQNADEIQNIVINVANDKGVYVSDEQIATIVELLQEIAEQDYDYSDVEETLEHVEENVSDDASDDSDDDVVEVDPDSIMNNVNTDVLGEDVLESSTEDSSMAEVTNAGVSDETGDEEWEEYSEDELDEETDDEDITEIDEIDGAEEIENAEDLNTDFLSDEDKVLFEKAKKFVNGEYKGDSAALQEVLGADAICTVVLDSDNAEKLSNKVLNIYLDILGNGAASYEPTGTEKYMTAELNMLQKKLKDLFAIDLADTTDLTDENVDFLGETVTKEDKETLYKDTMHFFEVLYGENTETTVSESVDVTTETAEPEETLDEDEDYEVYDEEIDE